RGGVAALAPKLPIASNSIDLLVDSYGPGTWFLETGTRAKEYFSEISRVLAENGSARIFPIENVQDLINMAFEHIGEAPPKEMGTTTIKRAQEILKGIPDVNNLIKERTMGNLKPYLDLVPDINWEIYTKAEKVSCAERIGIKITKKEQVNQINLSRT
ncbi:hypothetical protein K0B04_04610, partial [Patescibacteria group bacterium]|nr:hypothetical protein [Patescibacteria group bacterium]